MSTDTPDAGEHFNKLGEDYERFTSGTTRLIAHHLAVHSEPIKEDSVILDNASGPGILVEEVISNLPDHVKPQIKAVDLSPALIDVLRHKADQRKWSHVECSVMPGENLEFGDNVFSHAFTNFGIMFFKDPVKGASEIYRTLKPGGVAYFTTWADLGHPDIIRKAEGAIRPGEPEFQFPIPKEWESAAHAEKVMRDAGFEKVSSYQQESMMRADSPEKLGENLKMGMGPLIAKWSDEEKAKFASTFGEFLQKSDHYSTTDTGQTALHMVANIIVCHK